MARMLPGEAGNGVGMYRSAGGGGKKCKAILAVQRTGCCAVLKLPLPFNNRQRIQSTRELKGRGQIRSGKLRSN